MAPSILLVEPNTDDELLTRRMFARHGIRHELAVVASGPDALACLAGEALPRVLLVELMLPGMSGVDLITAVRRNPRTSALPVVILVASEVHARSVRALRVDAAGILIKPLEILALRAALTSCGVDVPA